VSSRAGRPVVSVEVDAREPTGPLEWWRLAIGVGGVNAQPLSPRVVQGLKSLRPRLIRIFVQEFFRIYPDHGRFDWSRLDPYMDSLAATGAEVMASIAIKPRVLFPRIDPAAWRPADVPEWQRLIEALVRRYSVERRVVTHWGVGNEVDIGEQGGCPYLIPDPDDYNAYYEMTVGAIRRACPGARVGGPSAADGRHAVIGGLAGFCESRGLPLDFVAWNCYSDDPARHAGLVAHNAGLVGHCTRTRPQLVVTEWNKLPSAWLSPPVSVGEQAFSGRRAAAAAAIALSYLQSAAAWAFYYHAVDQTAYYDELAPFLSDPGIMLRHWNELPHRLGLFGPGGEVRPQFFVLQALSRMGSERVAANCSDSDLHVLAGRDGTALSLLLANYGLEASREVVAALSLRVSGRGPMCLTVARVDDARRWDDAALELLPVERRVVDAPDGRYSMQVLAPADSVTLVRLAP